MSATLEIQDLSVTLRPAAQPAMSVIEQVNFCLHSGKTLVLVGESGCGKSLTSLALMRLLPDHAYYSKNSAVLLQKEDILEIPEYLMQALRGRRLAMIFQEPMTALNPVLSVGEQLAEVLTRHQRLSRRSLRVRILELLEEVEIPQPEIRLRQYPHQLSGGQKQRVMIAMAIANRPEVLIADEPTTALDMTIQAQILALLKKLQQQHQMSLLLITHDLGIVKRMADNVCVMYAGQIVEAASAEQFFNRPLHPYVQKMFVALPSLSRREQPLQVISGQVPHMDQVPSGCRFHPRCVHAFEPCSHIQPELQTLTSHHLVRCHLYPEHKKPPPLPATSCMRSSKEMRNIESECVLDVQHLSVRFTTKMGLLKRYHHQAVEDLSFKLYRGKTLALVGESGCGKTTVARVLLKLSPFTSGHIYYRGHDIQRLPKKKLHHFRKNVQIVFQDPFSSLNPRMTIDEILAEGMRSQGTDERKIERKQRQLLEQIGLPRHSLRRYPHQFSGGQRQRICIARALAVEPEVLICDEPTSALDVSVQAQILNLLKELQSEYGLSYLFITHNMAVVAYLADEVLVMRHGRAVERGDCQTVFKSPQERYTQRLLRGAYYEDLSGWGSGS